jgi:hypothetical protein
MLVIQGLGFDSPAGGEALSETLLRHCRTKTIAEGRDSDCKRVSDLKLAAEAEP